jgi:hypothetical protein
VTFGRLISVTQLDKRCHCFASYRRDKEWMQTFGGEIYSASAAGTRTKWDDIINMEVFQDLGLMELVERWNVGFFRQSVYLLLRIIISSNWLGKRTYIKSEFRCKTWSFYGGDSEESAFWDVTLCGSSKNRRFGGTYRIYHHGEKNQRERPVTYFQYIWDERVNR